MNRIEAINAMLDGATVIETGGYWLKIENRELLYYEKVWLPVSYKVRVMHSDHYNIWSKPADNYAMIDGEKWKLTKVKE